ncbi:MAG: FkbM family methyltransferase [Planctomycetes bacterium]|nr:FkbM family methyltransferase [Planctomycetota bacterium]
MKVAERLHAMHRFWRYRLKQDRHELAYIRKHVAAGETVLDIGANRGAYSYWLAKAVGPSGTVYAFEPQQELAQYVEDSKQAFQLSNVTVINKALSCTTGEAELFRPDCHPWGGGSLESFPDCEGTYVTVPTQRLDDFVAQEQQIPRPISFIKCDVQDHELQVLQGAQRVLREDRPTLFLECMPYCWGELSTYLDSIGYLAKHVVVNHKMYTLESADWKKEYDHILGKFFFVHQSCAETRRAA